MALMYFKLWMTSYFILAGIFIWLLTRVLYSYENPIYWKMAKRVGIFTVFYVMVNILITIWTF